jgi:putative PIN family toxin of toxin-antitoxin system
MRLVLDSNVIIAAFAGRGLCHGLVESCLDNHDVFIGEFLLSEVSKNLQKKIKLPSRMIQEILTFLNAHAEIIKPQDVEPGTCRDPNDLPIIGIALAAQADYLITGDEDLLVLKKVGGTSIVNPRSFWELLTASKPKR